MSRSIRLNTDADLVEECSRERSRDNRLGSQKLVVLFRSILSRLAADLGDEPIQRVATLCEQSDDANGKMNDVKYT